MDRRNFLKLGTGSCLALSAVSITSTLTGCTESLPANSDWKVLRQADREFFTALAPVVLKGTWPEDAAAQAEGLQLLLQNIDSAIFNLGPHNYKQIIDLFNLLNFSVSRGLTTGVWSKWSDASEAEIEHFLNKWRESSLGLLNLGYNGISKLLIAVWYGMPQVHEKVGYPGPPHAGFLITKPA